MSKYNIILGYNCITIFIYHGPTKARRRFRLRCHCSSLRQIITPHHSARTLLPGWPHIFKKRTANWKKNRERNVGRLPLVCLAVDTYVLGLPRW
jgi:hypothetical protein